MLGVAMRGFGKLTQLLLTKILRVYYWFMAPFIFTLVGSW